MAACVGDAFEMLTGARPELSAPMATAPPPGPYRVSVQRLGGCGLHPAVDITGAVAETAAFCIEHRESLSQHE
jgi:hypothetical protein